MSEINNYVNMPAAQPVVKKRRGRGLAVVAMIMGIFSNAASLFTAWLVFWLAYGRENMALIRTATISLVIPAVAIAALILSIVAKKIGAGKAMMIATIVNVAISFVFIASNLRCLIYYIGMTF